jgi:hypothetical protein
VRILPLVTLFLSAPAWGDEPAPPVPEARPRTVYVRMTGGRRVEGKLLGHDDDTHWIQSTGGVVRIRMSDVASMSDTPLAATAETAPLPRRWDPRRFLLITGTVVFALSYVTAIAGIDDADEDGYHLAIPVVGPFAYAMVTGTTGEQSGLLTFGSFVEAAGLVMAIYGLVGPPPAPFIRTPE